MTLTLVVLVWLLSGFIGYCVGMCKWLKEFPSDSFWAGPVGTILGGPFNLIAVLFFVTWCD